MPSLVIGFITPILPLLNDKTLWCFSRDLDEPEIYGGLGDDKIDKPGWVKFKSDVDREIEKRKTVELLFNGDEAKKPGLFEEIAQGLNEAIHIETKKKG